MRLCGGGAPRQATLLAWSYSGDTVRAPMPCLMSASFKALSHAPMPDFAHRPSMTVAQTPAHTLDLTSVADAWPDRPNATAHTEHSRRIGHLVCTTPEHQGTQDGQEVAHRWEGHAPTEKDRGNLEA